MCETAMPTPVAWSKQAARTSALGWGAAGLPALTPFAGANEAIPFA